MTSAIPQLSWKKVVDLVPGKNSRQKSCISIIPIRIMAAVSMVRKDRELNQGTATFGVITPAKAIDETGRQSNNILAIRQKMLC
jgi:hypothetical protein